MQLTTALLCDAASVRDRLLFVLGGGITQVYRSQYPAELKCSLALVFEMHPTEARTPHEVVVILQDEDGGRLIERKGGIQVAPKDPSATSLTVPVVIDVLTHLPRQGSYTFDVLLDGSHARTLAFATLEKPE